MIGDRSDRLDGGFQMRSSTVAKGLLMLGVLVGGAAGVALALGFRVDQLPPWMITVGMYKLAFIAAGGLLAAGAVLGRAAQKRLSGSDAPIDAGAVDRIGPGSWKTEDGAAREADRINRNPRQDHQGQGPR
jgi:hypothetical protein